MADLTPSQALQAKVDALNDAIAAAERQITNGDESVTYQTTASLIQARNDLQRQQIQAADREAGKIRPRQTLLQYGGRGY